MRYIQLDANRSQRFIRNILFLSVLSFVHNLRYAPMLLCYCSAQRFEYSVVASNDGQAFGAKSEWEWIVA